MMLELENVNTFYGSIHALKDVSMNIQQGEIVTLIGSNGAGKTTTLSSIIGSQKTRSGKIRVMGQDITNRHSHEIVKCGIGLSPEGRLVFPDLTVEENLRIGAYLVRDKAEIQRSYSRIYELFPRLAERRRQQAGTLSGGEQQMLAIGRALMNDPKLLMLDEPSLGLAPNLVLMIFELIQDIRKAGVTILLIEQNANIALHIADRGYVLETGHIKLSDTAQNLSRNDAVRKAYLGG